MQTTLDQHQLKGLIKEALVEIIEERKDLLRDALEDALEEIAMVRAIEEGNKSEIVGRDEVFAIFENAA